MGFPPLVVSVVSDDPFAIDVAHYLNQKEDISDLISLKNFANTEYCPRFIKNEMDKFHAGHGLDGQTVIVISTFCGSHSRNSVAMKTFLVARAAKDNGAKRVIIVEPDLYYSAQDRGPRPEQGAMPYERQPEDYKKFDGQPFSSKLYAQLLKQSGVDGVVTVHNHSVSVQNLFAEEFGQENFLNLIPAELYARYLIKEGVGCTKGNGLIFCAPDAGATPFVQDVFEAYVKRADRLLLKAEPMRLEMAKVRTGERKVSIEPSPCSPAKLDDVKGKDIVVFDDMVRTGNTIVECCKVLKAAGANRVVFVCTHFYSSQEVKENLNSPVIDEIITTNTLPKVLNRDCQGRLRKKMLVLKIEKWVANVLAERYMENKFKKIEPPFSIDLSAKNPRWRPDQNNHTI